MQFAFKRESVHDYLIPMVYRNPDVKLLYLFYLDIKRSEF